MKSYTCFHILDDAVLLQRQDIVFMDELIKIKIAHFQCNGSGIENGAFTRTHLAPMTTRTKTNTYKAVDDFCT